MRRMFSLDQIKNIADSEVKSLVEGGTLENAKPIYYHPLSTFNNSTSDNKKAFALSFTILNNEEAPYTLPTFIVWIKALVDELSVAIINVDGFYDTTVNLAYLYIAKTSNPSFPSGYMVYCVGNDGTGYSQNQYDLDAMLQDNVSFNDGVNKIN